MPYIKEDGGLLNNFAIEPKIYEATPPSKTEQRNYVIMGAAALALVGSLIFVAVSVSGVS
ncbi:MULTISPECIES: photosystem II assembly protein Psb34 [Argonema]|uniref:photosystem II assembly protein Psb34 n=1 Tax=Argonema TaxID=2942761 RepID=UPI002013450D|nr:MULTISPECIES: ssl1498 family light-harvesting-like protein [Argonema]MCL1463004.1 ssl1498 family light-harvesting-like protein [Argonema galeatum A003/A1]MCL1469120.1 ssl1498 family light-harvesting-like protein [Argonema antarcticum A004/B2]